MALVVTAARRGAAPSAGRWSRPGWASRCRCGRRTPPTTAPSWSTRRCPAGSSATCTGAVRHGLARRGLGARHRAAGAGRAGRARCCCPAPLPLGRARRGRRLVAVAGGAVVLLSALAVAGHLVVFLVAAQSVGVTLSTAGPAAAVGALVLLGSSIPLNVAGLGAARGRGRVGVHGGRLDGGGRGSTVAVTFGVLATVATLPGLLALQEESPWLTAPTRCSPAGCRSTATSTTPPTSGCSCPTTPTSTGSTRCAPAATRSWSAPPRCATTTRGCWCAPRPGRAVRRTAGRPAQPLKVTVTNRAKLDPGCALLHRRHRRQARLLRQRHRRHGRRRAVVGRPP